ncbi:MAG: SRPBCC family protein [Myxococcales bacterium]|nr:SRPBCC family protein [Myxococcales bacterium]
MASNTYDFSTRWRLPYPAEVVFSLLSDPESLPRWWPSVYLAVETVEPGDDEGLGRIVRFHTKGWLPYTLQWSAKTTRVARPVEIAFDASGDFDGQGRWSLTPLGPDTEVLFRWQIRAEKPLLRELSFMLRPVFEANHQWAMDRGYESLLLELERMHAPDAEARARVRPPPAATPSAELPVLMGAVGAVALVAGLSTLLGRRGSR